MIKDFKTLELFCGTKSFSKIAKNEFNAKTFTVDFDEKCKPDLCKDIQGISIEDLPYIPDVVWASPQCKTYSIAGCFHHRDENYIPKTELAKKDDEVNKHLFYFLNTLNKINPDLIFFVENPRGLYRKMFFIPKKIRRSTVWYCQYGDRRAKPTDIFNNSKTWRPRGYCFNNSPYCNHMRSPRGENKGTASLPLAEKFKIPEQLCFEVLKSAITQIEKKHHKNLDN